MNCELCGKETRYIKLFKREDFDFTLHAWRLRRFWVCSNCYHELIGYHEHEQVEHENEKVRSSC